MVNGSRSGNDSEGLRRLLKELVGIPSVNRKLVRGGEAAGEGRLAEYVGGFLEETGFQVERIGNVDGGAYNIVATFGPADAARVILFEAHMDTVGVAGMRGDPFRLRQEGGRLYGRGACDDKGPLAAALWALRKSDLEKCAASGTRVVFAGARAEETGNEGAAELVAAGVRADEAIILEPTDLAVVYSHKGAFWYRLEVTGRAAHGSDPSAGLSAVRAMRRVMDALDEMTAAASAGLTQGALGFPTINIGVIEGGDALNIVPQRCRIEVDRRVVPGEDVDAVQKEIHRKLEEFREEGLLETWSLEVLKQGAPFTTSPQSMLVKRLQAACLGAGVEPRLDTVSWYSDAGVFSEVCGEVVVFGPGSIAQAHTADEYIEEESLYAGYEVLRNYLRNGY